MGTDCTDNTEVVVSAECRVLRYRHKPQLFNVQPEKKLVALYLFWRMPMHVVPAADPPLHEA